MAEGLFCLSQAGLRPQCVRLLRVRQGEEVEGAGQVGDVLSHCPCQLCKLQGLLGLVRKPLLALFEQPPDEERAAEPAPGAANAAEAFLCRKVQQVAEVAGGAPQILLQTGHLLTDHGREETQALRRRILLRLPPKSLDLLSACLAETHQMRDSDLDDRPWRQLSPGDSAQEILRQVAHGHLDPPSRVGASFRKESIHRERVLERGNSAPGRTHRRRDLG